FLLAGKVPIHRTLGETGGLGDVVNRRSLVALLGEHIRRGGKQSPSRFFPLVISHTARYVIDLWNIPISMLGLVRRSLLDLDFRHYFSRSRGGCGRCSSPSGATVATARRSLRALWAAPRSCSSPTPRACGRSSLCPHRTSVQPRLRATSSSPFSARTHSSCST